MTVIPFYSPEKIWALYSPFIDYLRETTGQPWELKFFADHNALINGLCGGEVSFALLGPVPLGRSIEQCNAETVGVALGNDGKPFYHSVLVTSEPNIVTIGDLKGKKFALFKGSTAAHILPRKMLREAGLQKNDVILFFYESQDSIVNALMNREVAGAGIKEALFRKFEGKSLRILKLSDQLPNFAFAAAPTVTAGTKKLFADALFRLSPQTSEQNRQRMKVWDDEIKNGFINPPDSFRTSVLDLLTISNEIMREDQ